MTMLVRVTRVSDGAEIGALRLNGGKFTAKDDGAFLLTRRPNGLAPADGVRFLRANANWSNGYVLVGTIETA